MKIERHETGPRMSKAVIHGDTVYLAGIVADNLKGKSTAEQTRSMRVDFHPRRVAERFFCTVFRHGLLNSQGGTKMRKTAKAAVTCFVVVTSFAALAASAFEGVWKVKDTAGHPFEITLSSDGAAKATRGEGMTGTWKEEGNSAVITWNTGWTTKITKEGDRYIKAAYGKGQSLTATPTNTSEAEKAK